MKKLKQIIKKVVPDILLYKYMLYVCKSNSKKNYDQIEKITNKKYYKKEGYYIDWDNPKSFTEKINVSKLYAANAIKTELTDKVAVRDWVEKQIGKKYLIPIYGVYDSILEVPFEDLPEQFVIKCSHDSNSVTIVDSKRKLDKRAILRLIKKYDGYLLKRNFAYFGFEKHYLDIPPKIIIEKCLGKNIKDYKFLCFGGSPYYCLVDFGRYVDHRRRNVYDLNWNLQPFRCTFDNYDGDVEKPQCFSEMVEVVKKLCKDFDHVRVDLYEVDGKVYFGEMTFTTAKGMGRVMPMEWDYKLGELWDFDNSLRKKIKKDMVLNEI